MAIVGTGKWQQTEADLRDPMPQRDFFEPDTVVADTTYVEANKLEFGFYARELHVFNSGGSDLVYQWPRNDGSTKDNGVIPAGESRIWREANKGGINFRVDAGSATYRVEAIS